MANVNAPSVDCVVHTLDSAMKEATHRHYKGGLYRLVTTYPDWTNGRDGQSVIVYEHLWPNPIARGVREMREFMGTVETENGIERRFMPLKAVTA